MAVLTVVAVAAVLWLKRDTRSLCEDVASGGQLTLVAASDEPLADPSVSFDGKMLAYIALDKQNTSDVFVRRAAGGSLVGITNDRAREGSPRFSSDGERLAFTRLAERMIRRRSALSRHWVAMRSPRSRQPQIRDGRPMERRLRSCDRRLPVARSYLSPASTDRTRASCLTGQPVSVDARSRVDSGRRRDRDRAWIGRCRRGDLAGAVERRSAATRHRGSAGGVLKLSGVHVGGLGIVHSSNRGGATNIWFFRGTVARRRG